MLLTVHHLVDERVKPVYTGLAARGGTGSWLTFIYLHKKLEQFFEKKLSFLPFFALGVLKTKLKFPTEACQAKS
jgi:hypothetical protein